MQNVGMKFQKYNPKPNLEDEWIATNNTSVNSLTVGTPCLRYYVRQPDKHKDVDDRDSGEYSFAAFGYRKEIGGTLEYFRRCRNGLDGNGVVAYCPSFQSPFGYDFLGVMGGDNYNFEVLDELEQKKSLVGSAHLHIHTADLRGAIIVAFNANGSLRYIEIKNGLRRFHDSIIVFQDRIEIKLGTKLTGIRRHGEYKFGVPLWAFSEDISCKILINFLDNDILEFPALHIKNHLLEGEAKYRFGHPKKPDRFMNRSIGKEVEASIPIIGDYTLDLHGIDFESAGLGISKVQTITYRDEHLNILIRALNDENFFKMCVWKELFDSLSCHLKILEYYPVSKLTVNIVAEYAEYLYSYFKYLKDCLITDAIFLSQENCSKP